MNRRDFLKLGGVSSLFLFFPAWKLTEFALASAEAEHNGQVYRGTANGEIYVSENQRQTWRKHVGLGSEYSVSKLFRGMNGRLYAQVDFQKRAFYLSLSLDGKNWLVG